MEISYRYNNLLSALLLKTHKATNPSSCEDGFVVIRLYLEAFRKTHNLFRVKLSGIPIIRLIACARYGDKFNFPTNITNIKVLHPSPVKEYDANVLRSPQIHSLIVFLLVSRKVK